MNFYNIKEYNNRLLYSRKEIYKIIYKSILANTFVNKSIKIFCYKLFIKSSKFSSISYYRNFCIINNWSRSVFRDFKMSRHQAKAFSSTGVICGVRKSSF